MTVLVIGPNEEAEAKRVLAYAEAHHYRPRFETGEPVVHGDEVPGSIPGYVAYISRYRCVFTYTHADDMVYRQLTISLAKNFPSPIAAFMLAELFGFTGWDGKSDTIPEGWLPQIREDEGCVMLAQPFKADVVVS